MNELPRIGITGGRGFMGWHLRCRVRRAGWPEPMIADRSTFADADSLRSFVGQCDAIVHLAGVNRAASEDVVASENRSLAKLLGDAIRHVGTPMPLVYSNSVKSLEGGAYGEAKAAAADILEAVQTEVGGTFADAVLPHLFGEFGAPFYNSAVTTFAYQLANGDTPVVENDSTLELLHAQEAADLMLELVSRPDSVRVRPEGRKILVSDVKALLEHQYDRYVVHESVPAFEGVFAQRMFNVLRSQLYSSGTRSFPIERHSDARGFFAELIRNDGLGQSSISASVPGITRGDHYHLDKVERFLVVSGEARIRIRRLLTDEVHIFDVAGTDPVAIDMPPLCTHNITNTGSSELITFFWAADHFDPARPDTFAEPVEVVNEPGEERT